MSNIEEIIFIIDDESEVRDAISLYLTADDYIVETYSSSEEYLARETWQGTGCLILDVNLTGKSGVDLQEELFAMNSHIPVIFITGQANIPLSVQTVKKGAVNFLEKPFRLEVLMQSIQEALLLSRKLKSEKDDTVKACKLIETLSEKELAILKYFINGMLNKQIASELSISEQTIKHHRISICTKLGVKSVPEIIRIADKAGITPAEKKY